MVKVNKISFNLYVWFIIIIGVTDGLLLEKDVLTKYFKKYDIVDCYVSGSRTKRFSPMKDESKQDSIDREVRFKSYDIDFHLLLTEDVDFKKVTVESYSTDNSTKVENVNVTVFTGVLRENPLSYINGYVHNHLFVGTVKTNETLYFVEPATRFSQDLKLDRKIIVYREEDLKFDEGSFYGRYANTHRLKAADQEFGNEWLPKGINRTGGSTEDYACQIELVCDHTLYKHFRGDVNIITAFLYSHAKTADSIFRTADFNGDGQEDRIRIIPTNIFIYKSKNDPNYSLGVTTNFKDLLNRYSFRIQHFCLSICMVFRQSTDTSVGVSYTSTGSEPGGICQKPVPYARRQQSKNVCIVTALDPNNVPLPFSASSTAFTHELGHGFGSTHDSMNDLTCTPGGKLGYYIMHFSSLEVARTNRAFSSCSKEQILNTIKERGECLKPHPATCGNAVREGDEECDCGSQKVCSTVDPCCTPSDAKSPEKGCTFHKGKAACSPRESECCEKTGCVIRKNTGFRCNLDDEGCMVSYCDGESATCPKLKPAANKVVCRGTSRTCSGGKCNSTVCFDNGRRDCICTPPRQCYVCCEDGDLCVTATSLGFLTNMKQEYFLYQGTLCKDKQFQCDGLGDCVDTLERDKSKVTDTNYLLWGIGVLAFSLLITLAVLIYYVKKHSSKK